MKDFPVFDTENGVASLVLREIPYTQKAYIKILDTQSPEALLDECRQFCTMVGAEHIYASGDVSLEKYPLYTKINELERIWQEIPCTDASVILVDEGNLSQWKDIYNSKMITVPNAAYMDNAAAKGMLRDGSGYFVKRNDQIVGIAKGAGDTIEAIASTVPGAGASVLFALCRQLGGERFRLQVADANIRAMALYERLGFVKSKEISSWYKIL